MKVTTYYGSLLQMNQLANTGWGLDGGSTGAGVDSMEFDSVEGLGSGEGDFSESKKYFKFPVENVKKSHFQKQEKAL